MSSDVKIFKKGGKFTKEIGSVITKNPKTKENILEAPVEECLCYNLASAHMAHLGPSPLLLPGEGRPPKAKKGS